MDCLTQLQEMASEVETKEPYQGYFYKAFYVVTILVVGSLWSLQTAHEIYQWSCAKAIDEISIEDFGIEQLPCYAQSMNILGNVKVDSFDNIFIKWCKMLVQNQVKDNTIVIDGKTVYTTGNMQTFDSPLHIVSAYVAEYSLAIDQVAVDAKSNKIPAVQALIKTLHIQDALVIADAMNC